MTSRFLKNILTAFVFFAASIPLAQAETIKVGATGGPHAEILEQVKALAAKDGLDIKIIEFDDYQLPNAALVNGDLDANSFQHQPFLDAQVQDRGYPLTSIAKTVIFPIGIYSKKIKSLADLKEGDKVAIPNDPTNGGRVLLLLQANGLLTLRPDAGIKASPLDIVGNPKKLKIVELPAAQLPRSLDDVTAAAINTNYAIEVGLKPDRDALVLEKTDSPYANIIAVRTADKDKPALIKLVKFYQSAEIKAFIKERFGSAVIPAF
ncbi:MetQ/NlpA family ABC transporter substrate-binding protein [Telmatospirillum siberiense]|uniref:Metal ABC transporter substrate-binding protein n=1 Tax=Telmatospirillum siberiense TaxID=382514 RepID=A0A2N3PYK8_9PROT|nr:MetQ/NlpA family ABC transporter substrate-binding protein [Telmatospirillum siberiense]PKU25494.1 metal ABC transporter substrate-binding protein [Telmatospirillum siberiense]